MARTCTAYESCDYGACAVCDPEIAANHKGNFLCDRCGGEYPMADAHEVPHQSGLWYMAKTLCPHCFG